MPGGPDDRSATRPTATASTSGGPLGGGDAPALAGSTLSHYRIVRRIGAGGMGEVFLAEDTSLGRQVALKFLPPGVTRDDTAHTRLVREARAAAALSHPYVCAIHEVVEFEGRDVIVMEYVDGQTLRERLATGPIPLPEALRIAGEITEAVEQVHAGGIVHRDLKPSNIMLARQGHVKVMDFGIAKRVRNAADAEHGDETDPSLTADGTRLGTLAYMSPEQLRGDAVDQRSDQFSLGVVLYEIVTRLHPFRRETAADTAAEILHSEPKPLSEHGANLPGALERVIRRLLAKDPASRYPSLHDVRADLDWLIQQLAARQAGPVPLLRRALGMPLVALPTLALLAALAWLAATAIRHERQARWAREVALPQAELAIERDDYTTAFRLVERAGRYVPDDPVYLDLVPQTRGTFSLRTDPPGAEVRLRDYAKADGEWQALGRTPLDKLGVPQGHMRWKASLSGYEPVEGAAYIYRKGSIWASDLEVRLDKAGTLPRGMVRVQGGMFQPTLLEALPELTLGDYLLDRYEVTNRQYREFVEAGGYRRPEYWRHPFVKDSETLSFEAAMRLLVDKTGLPGPATWEMGDYPEGRADYPVSGVSWYEAAAFAEFAGKSLPTLQHWNYAAVSRVEPWLQNSDYLAHQLRLSNFTGTGLAPGGRFQGLTPHGIYDMAGNVKEWVWNELTDGQHILLGGGWDEPQYMYSYADRYPPFFRQSNFGFRCMKRLGDSDGWKQAAAPVTPDPVPSFDLPKPCSNEVFQAYRRLYDYTRSDLNARVETRQDIDAYTRVERVSFDAAYGDERVFAYLFLPSGGRPPFQAVIHFPGGSAYLLPSALDYAAEKRMHFVMRTGRAWVLPVMWGTFERRVSPEKLQKASQLELSRLQFKDFRRTLDYLETRPDIDADSLAFEGLSWGAWVGGILPAIEDRLKMAVLYGGGVKRNLSPELSQANFAPRIRIPILMQQGRYDFIFPLDTSARPLLRLFGTPEQDKELKVYETGHAVWMTNELYRDEAAFLDKHLGRPQ